ncbi:protein SGT1 homolog [Ornithodoros turicata]|uniref:protein SGT1 homolog n=1 Tax=Ornithodoros turicata TaxID=34597 RepID=UPI0031393311
MAESLEDNMSRGNSAFVDENYAEALHYYTKALEHDPDNGEAYLKRSHANAKLNNHEATIADVDAALERGCRSAKGFLRKGEAAFELADFSEARAAFLDGISAGGDRSLFDEWTRKCDAELEKIVSAAKAVSKIRHDWYQTESRVIIAILLKNLKPQDVHAEYTSRTVDMTVQLPSGGPYQLSLRLAHSIVPEETTYKCLATKVEIQAKKEECIWWSTLEEDPKSSTVPCARMATVSQGASAAGSKNWDRICKQEEDSVEEGDAALNALFQKIYAEGSDDVKRAMNKSFMESGGTVLSTNWKEVSSKTTPVKPPDCMEYKKWN